MNINDFDEVDWSSSLPRTQEVAGSNPLRGAEVCPFHVILSNLIDFTHHIFQRIQKE